MKFVGPKMASVRREQIQGLRPWGTHLDSFEPFSKKMTLGDMNWNLIGLPCHLCGSLLAHLNAGLDWQACWII